MAAIDGLTLSAIGRPYRERGFRLLAWLAWIALWGVSLSPQENLWAAWGRFALLGGLSVMALSWADLYSMLARRDWRRMLERLLLGMGAAWWLWSGLELIWPALCLGRGRMLAGAAMGLAAMMGMHGLAGWGGQRRKLALVGESALWPALERELAGHAEWGWRVVARASWPAAQEWLRLWRQLAGAGARHLVLAQPLPEALRAELTAAGARVHPAGEFFEQVTGKAAPTRVLLLPARRRWRRWRDAALAALALVLLAPLLALVAALVGLDAGRPILFRQRRVGERGRVFVLYKFRTMRRSPGDPEAGWRPAVKNDPRCTRLGRWLRRCRLDELPQLWNILRGEMSWVGPRPFAEEQERRLAARLPGYRLRWQVPPGATGWAQIHRGYCHSLDDNREKLAYDLFYIRHASWRLDLLILLRTPRVLLLSRGGQ